MARLPICEAVIKYAEKDTARFHMPGHKGMLDPLDVTEVPGTDNLHSPSEAILESEKLCANALGAKDAFFVVNGSTACNMAMLFSAGFGSRVLLGRDCHKSAINAIALSGQDTAPLFPNEDGVYTAEAVEAALKENHCDAVFITSPTYRGAVSPIADIAAVCKKYGAKLLVDSAHGAHFAFTDKLPPIPSQADMWCVSTHKTLEALTQTAVLLTGKDSDLTRSEVQRILNVVQSTSPSYILMRSIERSVLEPMDWDSHIERIGKLIERLDGIDGIKLLGSRDRSKQDITRLNISAAGITGHCFGKALEERGVYPEMADAECVTLITSPADKDEWYSRLVSSIESLGLNESSRSEMSSSTSIYSLYRGDTAMSVREALTGNIEYVDFAEAEGRVSAQAVGCYPPGTAILFPGERILPRSVRFLLHEEKNGADLFGLVGRRIAVVKER